MAWPSYALAYEDETKTALRVQGTGQDLALEDRATEVTEYFEQIAERRFVERDPDPDDGSQYSIAIVENHDLAVPQNFLYVRVRPIRVVTAVLVGNPDSLQTLPLTDYVFDGEKGMIILRSGSAGGGLGIWGDWSPVWGAGGGQFVDYPEQYLLTGLRGPKFPPGVGVAQVQYSGGYETTDDVSGDLKAAFIDTMARFYREDERKSQGLVQEVAQGLSIGTKFDPKHVSDETMTLLKNQKNFSKTARR